MNSQQTKYGLVTDLAVMDAYLAGATVVAFDFETTPMEAWRDDETAALDPHRGMIVGVSLVVAPTMNENNSHQAIYIPLSHHEPAGTEFKADAGAVLALLRQRVFENPVVTKIAHNLAFEAKFLLAWGITLVPPVYDTMAGALLIYKEEGHFRRLSACCLNRSDAILRPNRRLLWHSGIPMTPVLRWPPLIPVPNQPWPKPRQLPTARRRGGHPAAVSAPSWLQFRRHRG